MTHQEKRFVLKFSCQDRKGIVTRVTGFLSSHECNIFESAQFSDPEDARFFMRIGFSAPPSLSQEFLDREFRATAQAFDLEWSFHDLAYKPRVMILVSRLGHCLNDLLYRHSIGSLPMELSCVVSNHRTWERRVQHEDLPFYYLPVTPGTKQEQEQRLLELIHEKSIDLVILARYMQIFSSFLTERLKNRVINIHHSFLPSFKGAHPYAQAYQRGVKLIGATAHYVTQDLDEGPIIEQGIHPVNHACTVSDLTSIGQDIENQVLAKAVKNHLEHRIFVHGQRTVIFT